MMERGVVVYAALSKIAREQNYGAMALSCWPDFQELFGIVPCVPFSEMYDIDNVPISCEGITSTQSHRKSNVLSSSQPIDLMEFETQPEIISIFIPKIGLTKSNTKGLTPSFLICLYVFFNS